MTKHSTPRQPGGRRGSQGRWRVPVLSTVTALIASMIGVPAAPGVAATSAPAPVPALPAAAGAEITLITGDTVRVGKDAGGRTQVDVVDAVSMSFRGESGPDGTYLFPDTAEEAVASGLADRELFNVEYLAANGYDNASTKTLPVILDFGAARSAAATRQGVQAFAAAKPGRSLETLGASGASVDKAGAGRFWQSLTGGAGQRAASVAKVWLDRKVAASLDVSVPQIGAPQAWQAGYDGTGTTVAILDTGADATHPDLAGKVAATQNFTTDASVVDGHGHGTHVASTVAGSGAASGGKYKGVAPGARLVIGKALTNAGSGNSSWLIDAMEWAAVDQDADVISMSIGSAASDGTDPMSQAVNQLSETTGALFVIAAGNRGPRAETVEAPGAAARALTVGAVDKQNKLASFSSRGPLVDSYHVKPEITAPGVAIVAARAAGTSMGTPVDDRYTSAKGTSMATPHVAGAAAILAQQHPDWTGEQIKARLVSTAADGGYTAWEQGAGRVDVAKAVSQQLTVETAAISPGTVTTGDGPVTRTLTYTNTSTSDVTLAVKPDVRTAAGTPAPAGLVTVDSESVAIPAGGTTTVTVTINDGNAEFGTYQGAVAATTGNGAALRTPVGFRLLPQMATLTVRMVAPAPVSELVNYSPTFSLTAGVALRVDDQILPWSAILTWRATSDPDVHVATAQVPAGRYSIIVQPFWRLRSAPDFLHNVWVEEPEVTVEGATELVVDLRERVPVTVATDKPTEVVWHVQGSARHTASGARYVSYSLYGYPGRYHFWRQPTRTTPTIGSFHVKDGYILAEPEVVFDVGDGRSRATLNPIYLDGSGYRSATQAEFRKDANLGVASYADVVAGRDVRGKLVYIDMSDITESENCGEGTITIFCAMGLRVQAAAKAGAVAVVTSTGGATYWEMFLALDADRLAYLRPVPLLWLPQQQASQLAAMLDGSDSVTVHVDATPDPSYEYKLWFFEHDRVPPQPLAYQANSKDLKRVDAAYHSEHPVDSGDSAQETSSTFYADDNVSFSTPRAFYAPTRRVEYHSVTGPNVVADRTVETKAPDSPTWWSLRQVRAVTDSRHESAVWNATPTTPGQQRLGSIPAHNRIFAFCGACRQGDNLWLWPQPMAGDGSQVGANPPPWQARLFRGGTEIPVGNTGLNYPLAEGSDRYRLETVIGDRNAGSAYANDIRTTWNFTSTPRPERDEVLPPYGTIGDVFFGDTSPAAYQPLILLSYEIPLELDNTAKAGRPLSFTVHASGTRPGSGRDVRGLRLAASYDDGRTWTDATNLRRVGDGRFEVLLRHPEVARTTGAVTLRVTAWDGAGNEVVQTITKAYGLRAPLAGSGGHPRSGPQPS